MTQQRARRQRATDPDPATRTPTLPATPRHPARTGALPTPATPKTAIRSPTDRKKARQDAPGSPTTTPPDRRHGTQEPGYAETYTTRTPNQRRSGQRTARKEALELIALDVRAHQDGRPAGATYARTGQSPARARLDSATLAKACDATKHHTGIAGKRMPDQAPDAPPGPRMAAALRKAHREHQAKHPDPDTERASSRIAKDEVFKLREAARAAVADNYAILDKDVAAQATATAQEADNVRSETARRKARKPHPQLGCLRESSTATLEQETAAALMAAQARDRRQRAEERAEADRATRPTNPAPQTDLDAWEALKAVKPFTATDLRERHAAIVADMEANHATDHHGLPTYDDATLAKAIERLRKEDAAWTARKTALHADLHPERQGSTAPATTETPLNVQTKISRDGDNCPPPGPSRVTWCAGQVRDAMRQQGVWGKAALLVRDLSAEEEKLERNAGIR